MLKYVLWSGAGFWFLYALFAPIWFISFPLGIMLAVGFAVGAVKYGKQ